MIWCSLFLIPTCVVLYGGSQFFSPRFTSSHDIFVSYICFHLFHLFVSHPFSYIFFPHICLIYLSYMCKVWVGSHFPSPWITGNTTHICFVILFHRFVSHIFSHICFTYLFHIFVFTYVRYIEEDPISPPHRLQVTPHIFVLYV